MWRKNYKNKTANEWTWNIISSKQQFVASNCTALVYNLKTSENKCRSSQRKCTIRKAVLKIFGIFTEK